MEKISNQEAANRELKNDLLWAAQEIKALRQQAKDAETKAKAFDVIARITEFLPNTNYRAVSEDIVWRLNERIDAMNVPGVARAYAKAAQEV